MPDRTTTHSTVIPGMHYRNAADAIEWLCRIFGFEKHAVYTGPGNTIMHAELTLGSGMIAIERAVDDRGADLEHHDRRPQAAGLAGAPPPHILDGLHVTPFIEGYNKDAKSFVSTKTTVHRR